MIRQMAFGSRRQLGWIPCPSSGFQHRTTRNVAASDRGSGAPAVSAGIRQYKSFDFTWTDEAVNLQPVVDAFTYNDGPPYYFLNPAALTVPGWNALPPHWAAPGLYGREFAYDVFQEQLSLTSTQYGYVYGLPAQRGTTYKGAPLIGASVLPSEIATPANLNVDKYDGGAQHQRISGAPAAYKYWCPSATLIVPPGYQVYLLVAADFTNAAVKVASATSADGTFTSVESSAATSITAQGNSTHFGSATDWTRVDIGIGATTAGVGGHTLNLYGMAAYYVPYGTAAPTYDWSPGRGQMPLFPKDTDLNVTTYQAYGKELTAMQMNLTEGYISW